MVGTNDLFYDWNCVRTLQFHFDKYCMTNSPSFRTIVQNWTYYDVQNSIPSLDSCQNAEMFSLFQNFSLINISFTLNFHKI